MGLLALKNDQFGRVLPESVQLDVFSGTVSSGALGRQGPQNSAARDKIDRVKMLVLKFFFCKTNSALVGIATVLTKC